MLKVISGGQTGADTGGLVAAKRCGLDTGGYAANGFETENGAKPEYARMYHLIDKKCNKAQRTVENVKCSDGTLVFSDDLMSPGTKLTISTCSTLYKPYLINPSAQDVVSFIQTKNIKVHNIAGNPESVAPGITSRV